MVLDFPNSGLPSRNATPLSNGYEKRSPKILAAMTGAPLATASRSESCKIVRRWMLTGQPAFAPLAGLQGFFPMGCKLPHNDDLIAEESVIALNQFSEHWPGS